MTGNVTLRAFRPDTDLPLLQHWLSEDHVSAWWGDPKEAFDEVERRPDNAHAIIVWNGIDVGYVCWEKPTRDELEEAGLGHLPDSLLDVDVLLGHENAMGKGVAPLVGRALVDMLQAAGQFACIGVGMSVANTRAVRAAEKTGFRTVHEFSDPEIGLCRYMILGDEPHCSLRLSHAPACAQEAVAADRAKKRSE